MCSRYVFSSLVLALASAKVIEPVLPADGNAVYYHEAPANLDWWQTAVFYQIYPRSFMDSDGDGFGDLKGITGRLSHFKNTGITATWLSPIFQSPGVDQGYDISDYRTIDKIFGSIEDLKDLLAEAKKLEVRVILDFVPNHTSDEHEWFKLSENRTEGYEDYYVWVDGVEGTPPNNWISTFLGSAWRWSDKRKQYYFHQFHYKQPDLNYENPKVTQEMKEILTFYLDLGVDGFRVDAVPYLIEDTQFKDEPLASGYSYDLNDSNCLDHIYTKDIDATFDIIYEFREHVDAYAKVHNTDTKVLMTEAYSPMDKTMLFYGSNDGSRLGAHFTFNFNFIYLLRSANFTVDDLAHSINLWMEYMPRQYTSNWVLGNHDNYRFGNRLGKQRIDGFNMLIAFLPGIMVTYYGEEIGMLDGDVTCDQGWDPVATKNCSNYQALSRDFERTPFQWDSSKNAGFSGGNYTWLPVAKGYKEINLAAQDVEGLASHYNVYKDLIIFREAFQFPSSIDAISVFRITDHVVEISRLRDEAEYIYLFNFGVNVEAFDIYRNSDKYEVLVTSKDSTHKKGEKLRKMVLQPNECLILKRES